MTWLQFAACAAAAAIVLGSIGVARALRETNAERSLSYPPGSTETGELVHVKDSTYEPTGGF